MWGWHSLSTFWQDARYGVRLAGRSPVFSLFVVASLALGIGATGAIFSLYEALVLRELPVPQPDRLVTMSFAMRGYPSNNNMPYPHFAAMRDRSTTLAGLFGYTGIGRISVTARGAAELGTGLLASGDYYRTLGLQPALGRLLTGEDDRTANPVAVLSYATGSSDSAADRTCWARRSRSTRRRSPWWAWSRAGTSARKWAGSPILRFPCTCLSG